VLGTFVVFRSGTAVPSTSWPSKKARDLLKILAARGQTQRDVLVDLLWGADGTAAKLSVALSQLRSVLDPEHRHGSDHFVLGDRASVRLHPDHVAVDLAQFRVAAHEALAAQRSKRPDAVSLLEAAAAMYTGTFAADDLYEDWSAEPRQEAETLGAAVNRSLAYALADGPSPEQAVAWLSRLLNEDPYDEPTYRLLVGLLAHARRHGAARALHRTYALRMDELGVTPATLEELTG
jgi:DNA-binding SARP family transcriptional activator